MSRPLDPIEDDANLEGQTSNKAGLHSDRAKPSNAGPDSHEAHKAPVPGATGDHQDEAKDANDTPLGQWTPADKANLHNRK